MFCKFTLCNGVFGRLHKIRVVRILVRKRIGTYKIFFEKYMNVDKGGQFLHVMVLPYF